MKREEFLKECEKLSREELILKAEEFRNTLKGFDEETEKLMHSLDEETCLEEIYQETSFGRTHIYLVRPEGAENTKLPVMVNVHGGGWTLPHGYRDIFFCRRLANRLNILVCDVDYVLAPEAPYPAALIEIEALLSELSRLLPGWGGDPSNVVLCGQSAGGNLIAAVSERRKYNAEGLNIRAQILCYMPSDNVEDQFDGKDIDERALRSEYYGFFYNTNQKERANFDVSLTYSNSEHIKGLLPTEIITAGLDTLTRSTKKYNAMLRDNGVPGNYKCFSNSHHGFMVNLYDEYKEAEDYLSELMKKYFRL
ncbi:esterase/lipase [Lachnospiraceae bacterium JC7]|nr:esterase/lipase [Lachnospiraceae bacterium JC7]